MADFSLAGLSSGRSPDRLDALVYAVTELVVKPQREPRIRSLGDEGPLVPWWLGRSG
jgi:phage terminase large subunit-like protein